MLIAEAIKHRDKLVSRAKKIIGNDGEDVVSDLMEYFIRGRFNAPANPLPLLMWYVNVRCYDYKRRIKNKNFAPLNENSIQEHESTAENFSDKLQELELLLQQEHPFVSRLLVLHYAEGKTVQEISEETGIKKGRLNYIIRKARIQIKNSFELK